MNCFPNTWTTFCKFGYFYQFLPVSHQREIFLVVLKQKLFFKCNKISFPMESSYKILIILNCQPLLLKGRVSFVLEFEACHASACPRTMERGEVPSYSHSITFPYPIMAKFWFCLIQTLKSFRPIAHSDHGRYPATNVTRPGREKNKNKCEREKNVSRLMLTKRFQFPLQQKYFQFTLFFVFMTWGNHLYLKWGDAAAGPWKTWILEGISTFSWSALMPQFVWHAASHPQVFLLLSLGKSHLEVQSLWLCCCW